MSEWIISSSVLIVFVVILRYVLRGKINLRLQYALWLVVLVRLLMPVSLVDSSFSVAGLLQSGHTYELSDLYLWYGEEDAEQGGDVLPDNEDAPIAPKPDETPEKDPVIKEEPKYPEIGGVSIAPSTEKLENSGKEPLSLSGILTAIWCVGMAVTGATMLVSNLRFWLKLKKTRWFFSNHESKIPVYESSVIETPCLFGLIHPAVYVTPEAIGDPKMMHHVLTHETTHYAHRDHIWAALRCLCLVLHWYNPLVWWAAALSRRDAELACDEGAIERIGEAVRGEYGRTLIGLTCQGRSHLLSTATTMTGSVKGIKERIMLIANRPKMARYTVMILIVLVVGLIGCTYCGEKETDTGLGQTEESTEREESVSESGGEETEEPTTKDVSTEERSLQCWELNAQYLRTGWGTASSGMVEEIHSQSEFEAHCEEFAVSLESEPKKSACARYDETFWENYDLIVMTRSEGSGSYRHEVINMIGRKEKTGIRWRVNVRYIMPVIGSCDMAFWTILVEVPKGIMQPEDTVAANYLTDLTSCSASPKNYLRTDEWMPGAEDEEWYDEGQMIRLMDSEETLREYVAAHPELTEEFADLCGDYGEEFWQENDLILVVLREESGAVSCQVVNVFKNYAFQTDKVWWVELIRQIPEERTEEESLWHLFVPVEKGRISSENDIAIYNKEEILPS